MMYRKTTLSCLLAFSILQGCAQESKKEENLVLKSIYEVTNGGIKQGLDTYGLKGNVKTVEQRLYIAPQDSAIELGDYEVSDLSEDAHYPVLAGMSRDCKLTFDETGKLIYRIGRGRKFASDAIETDTLLYDESGNPAGIENRLVGDDFVYHTSTVFDYDENGHLTSKLHNGHPDVKYTYDEANNQVRVVWYDYDRFMADNLYTYDEYGLKVETHSYYEDGSLDVHWVHEYDDFGHLEREVQYYPNGDSHESKMAKKDKAIKVYRRYDQHGNCTKRLVIDADDRVTIRERKFAYY